ncbi:MAG: phosphoribosyl-AMP cyclohydrolase, partial [Luminiphilus sp.]
METIPTRMAPLWNEQGLIPVITQDATNGDVLMLAWMNEEALSLTLAEGRAVYTTQNTKQKKPK